MYVDLSCDDRFTWMIQRRIAPEAALLLEESPAVVLTGPRQVGKTTLALNIAEGRPATYLDLESEGDRARLSEPELYFADHVDELLVLDEIQRLPGLFETLRGVIDRGRREGRGNGRFLLLGSASLELLAQSGESLAGRVSFARAAHHSISPRSVASSLIDSGSAADSPRASWQAPTRRACAGGATSSAPTSSETYLNSARGSRRRRYGVCGRCSPTVRGRCSTRPISPRG